MENNSVKYRLIGAIIAVVIFFIGLYFDNYYLRMTVKPIPLFILISLIKPSTHYRKFIMIGLMFSVVGDILLETSPKLFAFGLVAFLIGHINYIIAFKARSNKLNIVTAIILLAFGSILYYILYPGLGKLAIPVLFYVLVILTMVWRSFSQRKFDAFAIFAFIGSLFFVFSDSLIALNKFYMPIQYSRGVIMITYWTAQSLIFYSAYKSEMKK
ncbi:MAG: hypothetical protein DRI86_15635 [Bacteroidetes bacterium]|nr:MAG: hypothetical protein DRI86_15635 [Bacteroidota bacterium]